MLDREFLSAFTSDAEAALEKLAKKHGVKLQVSYASGRYDKGGDNASLKFNLSVVTSGGKVLSRAAADFKALASRYGLRPTDLGTTFYDEMDQEFEITGLVARRRKFPISAKRLSDNRDFKFPARRVEKLLGR